MGINGDIMVLYIIYIMGISHRISHQRYVVLSIYNGDIMEYLTNAMLYLGLNMSECLIPIVSPRSSAISCTSSDALGGTRPPGVRRCGAFHQNDHRNSEFSHEKW